MNDYYYYKEKNGELYRFRIETDNDPWNPRDDFDGNIGHMMCWYSGYNLGDYKENKWSDPYEFLYDLMEQNSNRDYWDIREMEIPEMLNYLERKGYYFIPLAIYDHSGITMWCGSKWSHFDAQWDCSDIGWIYTTKKEILECDRCLEGKRKWRKVTNRNWKEAAQTWLEHEVEMYDMWLTDEVYGYIEEKWDGYDWIDSDSCWGFYSKKWGNELAREIANVSLTTQPFISEDEMETLCEEYTKQLEEDELVNSVSMVFA